MAITGSHVATNESPACASDIDLAGVDPLRFEEARRRVSVVKSYLAIDRPTDHDRKTHAASLNLSVNQLLALVRAWKETGRASALSAAGSAKGTPRPGSKRNLPTRSKEVALEVMRSMGSETSHVEMTKAVHARCAALGVKAPSRSTLWNMSMAMRRKRGDSAGEGAVVVARCNVRLPTLTPEGVVFPKITLIVDAKDGRILFASLDQEESKHPIASAIDCGGR